MLRQLQTEQYHIVKAALGHRAVAHASTPKTTAHVLLTEHRMNRMGHIDSSAVEAAEANTNLQGGGAVWVPSLALGTRPGA